MKNKYAISSLFILLVLLLPIGAVMAASDKQLVYDFAELLTEQEIEDLEALATKYGNKLETDFVIVTTNDTEGKDVVEYTQDFYDEKALGYDKPNGNTAILTVDMQGREIYLAGFYKAEKYLDDTRLDLIREKITPDMKDENYYDAFYSFVETSYEYMGFRPGVNPENIMFKLWFQLLVSLGIAGIIVGSMVISSGGKVTVNEGTYMDPSNSKVMQRRDVYIRKSVAKRKKPSNNNNSGGGGGGVTKGGHSHSGSRGSF